MAIIMSQVQKFAQAGDRDHISTLMYFQLGIVDYINFTYTKVFLIFLKMTKLFTFKNG